MRKLVVLCGIIGLLFSLSLTAVAKDKKKKSGKDVTEFSFEEDEVTVSYLKPEMGFVGLIQQEKAASLIKFRQDFVDEIVRSAEEL